MQETPEEPEETVILPEEPPMNQIFHTLRGIWGEQEGRPFQDLAVLLSEALNLKVSPQKLSQWSTGSDGRKPPWKAVYWLMQATGYEIKIGPPGVRLVRFRKGKEGERSGGD